MSRPKLGPLLHDYLNRSVPGDTLDALRSGYADERTGAIELSGIILGNPAQTHFILSQGAFAARIKEWREEDPRRENPEKLLMERLGSLLGKAGLRNLAASVRCLREAKGGLPRKKGERASVQPSQLLAMAIAAEEECLGRKWIATEGAFLAGFHYDLLLQLLQSRKAGNDAKAALLEAYQEGRKTARIAYLLSVRMKRIAHGKRVYPAALVAPIGQALMAVLYPKGIAEPSWAGFRAECGKLGPAAGFIAAQMRERGKFELSHAELSSLFVLSVGWLSEVEPAIRYYREPWALEGSSDPDQGQLARILSISSELGRDASLLGPNKPLPLGSRDLQWIVDAGVNADELRDSLLQIGKEA